MHNHGLGYAYGVRVACRGVWRGLCGNVVMCSGATMIMWMYMWVKCKKVKNKINPY